MSDMKNSYAIIEYPIKNFVRIADQRHDMNTGPFDNPLSGCRVLRNTGNNATDARIDGYRYDVAKLKAVSG